ncbi:MAG: phytanoyl-CoA dioxygenase family protein, partial [Candidatus Methylacidiphilales bacterium]
LRDIKCIRATLFDKTPGTNWKVPWHQDLTIPIQAEPEDRDAIALRAFGPWTNKDTIPHVQPPVHILERMLAARIHLDPCGLDNGALRVLAGSHRHGRLDAAQIKEWRGNADALVDCVAEAGDVLLMQPLLLHASSPATNPARRRVLHLEFAACDLPSPLQWRSF